MPQKHFYFSIGAACGVLIVTLIGRMRRQWAKTNTFIAYLYQQDKHWFLYFPLLIFLTGLWGLIPDALHALKILPKGITRSGLFDLFFLHSTFEKLEDSSPVLDHALNWIGEIVLLSIALGVMGYYIAQVKRALTERNQERNR